MSGRRRFGCAGGEIPPVVDDGRSAHAKFARAAELLMMGDLVEIRADGLAYRAGFVRERDMPHPTMRDLFPVKP